MAFRMVEHTADIKFKIDGKSLKDIFKFSAQAVASYISKEGKIKKAIKKEIKVEGEDMENLLYGFLDEIIFLLDAEEFLVADAEVSIDSSGRKLHGTLYGDKVFNYKSLIHVKAATYSEMYIKQAKKNLWEAQFVLDV